MVVMNTLGKDRFGLGPFYPGTDGRRKGESTADTFGLGERIWPQGRVLLCGSPGG